MGIWRANSMAISVYIDREYDIPKELCDCMGVMFNEVQSMQVSLVKTFLSFIFLSKDTEIISPDIILSRDASSRKNQGDRQLTKVDETPRRLRKALFAIEVLKSLMSSRHDIANTLLACISERLHCHGEKYVLLPHPIILSR